MTFSSIEPRCPICKSKGYISHDVVDGFDFGWSSGCPRFRLSDGIHGYKKAEEVPVGFNNMCCNSKEEAVNMWIDFCCGWYSKERVKE